MILEDFAALIERQRRFLLECEELDGAVLDTDPQCCGPTLKQHWTRADHRRRDLWLANAEWAGPHDSDLIVTPGRPPSTRTEVAAKLFDLRSPLQVTAQQCVEHCAEHSSLAEVSAHVLRMTKLHLEWLETFARGDLPGDVDERWEIARYEFYWLLRAHGFLQGDERSAEWGRWRSALTTVERRALLDLFWLAKSPLAKSQIETHTAAFPTKSVSGDAVRKKIEQVNKEAERLTPRCKWRIMADPKTKLWSKRWLDIPD